MLRHLLPAVLVILVLGLHFSGGTAGTARAAEDAGVLPTGEDGKPLNTDFETGDLRDWTATGQAFNGQPVKGDTIHKRRNDAHSNHAGQFWIGTFEIAEDAPRGTLTSKTFVVNKPWAKFLIGGGSDDESVDIVLADSGKTFFHATGDNREDMEAVAVDLRPIQGQKVFIRIIDDHSFAWGHVNFDDFKLYDTEPKVPKRELLTADTVKFAGLSPQDAVKAITVPDGFKVSLFAGEPDVHQPIAFTIDDRGRLWVAEAYTYPTRAPEGEGKDDILIFEDTNGDGVFDKRTVFATGLNLVSGFEVGFGGVWVGAAPYLMFIPMDPGADKPSGPPQILLDGWQYQDTHETMNAFTWGPDGWLYGCQGVFTHSRVGKPGTPDKDRTPLNCAVWRYHPTKHTFEIFAEGTSNPWGIDWNDDGQAFITACVIPHLWHIIEGAHYQRQAGSHFNPYVYRDIPTIADHVHWLGEGGPHAGNEKSGSAGGGHAHCGAMIYLGGSWPDNYRNSIFMSNIHGNRWNNDILEAQGSGYVGHHGADPVLMNDKWARIINMKYGPDGSVYFIDWYDKQACHNPITEIWDRTNGRIYKMVYKDQPAVNVDLSKATDDELVQDQLNKNDWYVRHARRLMQERHDGDKVGPKLREMMTQNKDSTRRLRALWALNASGALTSDDLAAAMKDENPFIRGWAIQLAVDPTAPLNLTGPFASAVDSSPSGRGKGEGDSPVAESSGDRPHLNPLPKGEEIMQDDPSPVVRLYIASALQRTPLAQRWSTLEKLVVHAEDASDHNLPLMYWWAAEPAVGADPARGIELAKIAKIPTVRELISRRICAVSVADAKGDVKNVKIEPLNLLTKFLAGTDDTAVQRDVLQGMSDGLKGWPSLPAPDGWSAIFDKLAESKDNQIASRTRELSVAFGEERALAAVRKTVTDTSADLGDRRGAIDTLVQARDPKLPPILRQLIGEPSIRAAAIRALGSYDDPTTPDLILSAYNTFDTPTKVDALNTLAARVEYAKILKSAVESNKIPRADMTAATLRQLASLDSPEIQKWLTDSVGQVRTSPKEKLKEMDQWKQRLTRKNWADAADPWHGRAVFAKTCIQCHTLYGVGGKVGPDLTGSNRADLNYILTNVIDPSAVIGKDYLLWVIKTKDHRVISGIIKGDDGNTLTVQTENQLLTIPKTEVTLQKQQPISMMPEGLLTVSPGGMSYDDVRDLIAYLGTRSQVPMLATKQNAATFFDGKDLTGWLGDESLWHVENGEIVGKTDGLKKNEFLFSTMAAANFRLTFQIKLKDNAGNSGMQFRSEALPDGEAKGYQADVGPGWWGKLYEENGRQILSDNKGEQYVKPGEWNTYEVTAIGSKITTKINGNVCVDLDDPKGAPRGIFGIQLHAGGPTEVRVKDLKLEVDP